MITLQTMPSEFAREDYSATFLGRHTYQALIRKGRTRNGMLQCVQHIPECAKVDG